jgi:hypothetical protein
MAPGCQASTPCVAGGLKIGRNHCAHGNTRKILAKARWKMNKKKE